MHASILQDVYYEGKQVELVGYYCSENRGKAISFEYRLNGIVKNVPVESVQRADFEKRYGVESNEFWYSVRLGVVEFVALFSESSSELKLYDENDFETVVKSSFLADSNELEKKIIRFLQGANKFALQGNEMARAMAYWLLLTKRIPFCFSSSSSAVLHLFSLLAFHLKKEGFSFPEPSSFFVLKFACRKFSDNQLSLYVLVLCRLSCVFDFHADAIKYFEEKSALTDVGGVEFRFSLVLLHLKNLLSQTESKVSSSVISLLFKRSMLDAFNATQTQAEMAEKMGFLCGIYHRIYHFQNACHRVGFGEHELASIQRKLYIASLGLLGCDQLDLYVLGAE